MSRVDPEATVADLCEGSESRPEEVDDAMTIAEVLDLTASEALNLFDGDRELGQALEEGSEFGESMPSLPTRAENEGVLATPLEQIEFSVRSRKALELCLAHVGDAEADAVSVET